MIVTHWYDAVRSVGHRMRWARLGGAPFFYSQESRRSSRHFGEVSKTISGQRNVQERLKTLVASRLS
jgi:hypothetical protein